MKKAYFLAICLLCSLILKAQETAKEPNFNRFQFGFGGGMGFFGPSEINSYISNKISRNGWILTSGSSDMFTNFFGHLSSSYSFKNQFGIRGRFEMALSPKIIYVNNGNSGEDFYFWRFSPGGFLFYGIPIAKGYTLNPEVGLFYHMMRFNDFKANKLSPRFQLGINYIYNETFGAELFLGIDFANAKINNSLLKELDYTGVVFGLTIFVTP